MWNPEVKFGEGEYRYTPNGGTTLMAEEWMGTKNTASTREWKHSLKISFILCFSSISLFFHGHFLLFHGYHLSFSAYFLFFVLFEIVDTI